MLVVALALAREVLRGEEGFVEVMGVEVVEVVEVEDALFPNLEELELVEVEIFVEFALLVEIFEEDGFTVVTT